jgi:hypothetical protein
MAGGDLGCLLHLAGRASAMGVALEIRHVAEVLAEAEVAGMARSYTPETAAAGHARAPESAPVGAGHARDAALSLALPQTPLTPHVRGGNA